MCDTDNTPRDFEFRNPDLPLPNALHIALEAIAPLDGQVGLVFALEGTETQQEGGYRRFLLTFNPQGVGVMVEKDVDVYQLTLDYDDLRDTIDHWHRETPDGMEALKEITDQAEDAIECLYFDEITHGTTLAEMITGHQQQE